MIAYKLKKGNNVVVHVRMWYMYAYFSLLYIWHFTQISLQLARDTV